MFATASHFYPSQTFVGDAGAHQSGALTGLNSKMMFVGLNQVYYSRFKCNTHNNYN